MSAVMSASVVWWVVPSVVPSVVRPSPSPVVPAGVAVVVIGRMPAVPGVVPWGVPAIGDVPDVGIIDAKATIACQSGGVVEVSVVEAVGVSCIIACVVVCHLFLCGSSCYEESVALELV